MAPPMRRRHVACLRSAARPAIFREGSSPTRLGCSEIYDELYLSCLLYRQIGRLVAFENATGVDAGQAVRSY
jgi:hypothetical protein